MNPLIVVGILSTIYGLTLYLSNVMNIALQIAAKRTNLVYNMRSAMLFTMAGVIMIYAGNV